MQVQIQYSSLKEKKEKVHFSESKVWEHHLLAYSFWKGIVDRLMALVIIIITFPFMVLIAIGIIFDSHGSPIFAQERVGKGGRKFVAYKFRTMHNDNDDSRYREYITKYVIDNAPFRIDQNGQGVYKVDNSNVTKFGALLRNTNLDELPQFINVLKGDMSIVGPRPDIPYAVELYKAWQLKRLNVKPGITGLWQVCGRKRLPFEGMVRLDINYIKRQCLLLDIKILLLTVVTVLKRDGS